ncbi:MAG: hypothetical protein LC725_00985 [Lentisphaerae bacterium]|nr:hypothetical protein [Lentisphaerota bacterium]
MNKLTSPVLLVGIPERHADLRYVAPFNCPDPVIYLLEQHRSHLLVGSMEAARARRVMPSSCRVWTPGALAEGGRRLSSLEECCAALLRRLSVRAVKVGGDFPLAMARRLEEDGCRLTVVSGGLFPGRAVKRPEELQRLRQCQCVAARAMDRAVRAVRNARVDQRGRLCDDRGLLTSERLRRLIQEALLAYGCEGPGTIAAGGRQAADPHEMGRRRAGWRALSTVSGMAWDWMCMRRRGLVGPGSVCVPGR